MKSRKSALCCASSLKIGRKKYLAMLGNAALVASTFLVSGCQMATTREPLAAPQQRPITVDDAMRHRDWSTSVAVIPTGATIGGPLLFAFEPNRRTDPPVDTQYLEIPIFLANVWVLPLVAIADPPWTPTVYRGVNLGPSYTMSPAYPEDLPAPPPLHAHKAGDEADAGWARHYRKNATTRPVF
ncbi:MAG TPA: hypothetical protein VGG19_19290 [Tepidisphaeraceae bacterium]|jgi:hypothetical protein